VAPELFLVELDVLERHVAGGMAARLHLTTIRT
jgi:hypothetical protein